METRNPYRIVFMHINSHSRIIHSHHTYFVHFGCNLISTYVLNRQTYWSIDWENFETWHKALVEHCVLVSDILMLMQALIYSWHRRRRRRQHSFGYIDLVPMWNWWWWYDFSFDLYDHVVYLDKHKALWKSEGKERFVCCWFDFFLLLRLFVVVFFLIDL